MVAGKKTNYIYVSVLLIIVLTSVCIWFFNKKNPASLSGNNTVPNLAEKTNLIKVMKPGINEIIHSPVGINGEARGYWYFEASFPIQILDNNGKIIGQGHAEAEKDWMTEEFVPFHADISFVTPETSSGFIALNKDNPSGLPEHDDQLKFMVRFR